MPKKFLVFTFLIIIFFAIDVPIFADSTFVLLHQKNGQEGFSRFGASVALLGDLDGDGRADFIVGAPNVNPNNSGGSNGEVYVYSGATGALLFQKTGAEGSSLGYSVAGIGDLNGDSVPEFIVGNPTADPAGETDVGSVFIYSGATGSLLYQRNGRTHGVPSSERLQGLGNAVAALGDIDGDGILTILLWELARLICTDRPLSIPARQELCFTGKTGRALRTILALQLVVEGMSMAMVNLILSSEHLVRT